MTRHTHQITQSVENEFLILVLLLCLLCGTSLSAAEVKADFDGDGFITAKDVDLIAKAAASQSQTDDERWQRYDLTGDTQVDASDVAAMLKFAQRINGDADFDGYVAVTDFILLADNFGDEEQKMWSEGDFDSNGKVEMRDYLIMAKNFGRSSLEYSPTRTSHFSLLLAFPLFWLRTPPKSSRNADSSSA